MGLSHSPSNFISDPNDSPQAGHFSFVLDLFMRRGYFSTQEVQSTIIPSPCRGHNVHDTPRSGQFDVLGKNSAATAEFSLWHNLTPLIIGSRSRLQIQQRIWSGIVSVQSNPPREHPQDSQAGCVFSRGAAELVLPCSRNESSSCCTHLAASCSCFLLA